MEQILLAIIAGIFGLVVGSFLNVCIYRIPININIAKGRSFCPKCKNDLKALDLFPVFSFIFLGGKCRYCKEKISPRYPIIELLNAALWAAAGFVFYQSIPNVVIYCLFFSVLIVAAMIDFDIQEVPYKFQIMILALAVTSLIINRFDNWQDKLIGAFAVSVPMVIITLLTGGFGGADYMIMAVGGLLLGWKNIVVAAFVGIILAAIYGVILKAAMKPKQVEVEIEETESPVESALTEADKPAKLEASVQAEQVNSDEVALTDAEDSVQEDAELAEETGEEEEPSGTKIPFVPFLAIGMAVAIFFGENLFKLSELFILF